LTRDRTLIQFISLHDFDRMAEELWLDDEDIRLIQQFLQETPGAGLVVQGTGGLRKVRISLPGRGKRGGGRLLYLYVQIHSVIYFVAVYAKADQEGITRAGYHYLARLVERLKEET
jgi:hypothetical protein